MLLINRYINRLDEFLLTVMINKKDRNLILESFIVESTDEY